MTALKAMTIWPAWQHFEEDSKGTIEVGKLADFAILDQDPTAIDPEKLNQLKVTETIKEGVTIFKLSDTEKKAAAFSPNDRSTLAFTRAVLFAASNSGQEHHEYEHGFGCACGVLSRLSNVMATGDDS